MQTEINNTMPISKEEYFQLQEYWDYQRKVEYNRELAYEKTLQVFREHEIEDVFSIIWSAIEPSRYVDPPKNYVPEDPTYRLDGEDIEQWRAIPYRFVPKEDA